MHKTVMVLNLTRERVLSEEKDASCVFRRLFVFWRLHEIDNHN